MEHPILTELNPVQAEAVSAPPGHMLILAGAGTGKTKTLTHRFAWLVAEHQVSPNAILAVTFTNKAAHEMRERIGKLLDDRPVPNWIGTFHGIAHRLLRRHPEEAGLAADFTVLDATDQRNLVRRMLSTLGIDRNDLSEQRVSSYINRWKDNGLLPDQIVPEGDPEDRCLAVYQNYQAVCARENLVDFAEMLLRAHRLWLDAPEVLHYYQGIFSHLLADEYQDTNALQAAWLKLLAGESACVMAVGDDDQAIYSWRGADITNILRFRDDYPDASLFRLEQNYRSTESVLNAANAIIARNSERLGKQLFTTKGAGDPVALYTAFNERDEANFIVARASAWVNKGGAYREAAVLYRSNVQSRVLEEALRRAEMPYVIHGGLRFFERAEIKNVLAYLRLVANTSDNNAFERSVNTPTRGIGERTIEQLRSQARETGESLWQVACRLLENNALPGRAGSGFQAYKKLIDTLSEMRTSVGLGELIEHCIEHSGLMRMYQKDQTEQGLSRCDNLKELITAGRYFKQEDLLEEGQDALSAFLSIAALDSGDRDSDRHADAVQLMTLHAAKGLEYPLVFIVGMEEGLLPHSHSQNDPSGLEEERRLCYVGITRAMQQLYLTHAEVRRSHAGEKYQKLSRFVHDIPPECLTEIRLSGRTTPSPGVPRNQLRQTSKRSGVIPGLNGMRLGQSVRHQRFGEGVILAVEGSGEHARAEVRFQRPVGSKWLMLSMANLELLD